MFRVRKQEIRNPKPEIPGPDRYQAKHVVQRDSGAVKETIGMAYFSRQGGPKQIRMTQIQIPKQNREVLPVVGLLGHLVMRILNVFLISVFENRFLSSGLRTTHHCDIIRAFVSAR
jgi:hypothetical protein